MNKSILKNYKIVYASVPFGLSEAACYLKSELEAYCGVEIFCEESAETLQEKQVIFLGNTFEKSSEEDLMSYRIRSEDFRIYLSCGGSYSAMRGVEELKCLLLEAEDVTFDKREILLSLDPVVRENGESLRIMTSNILADCWLVGGRPSVPQRAEIYAAVLKKYAPDLVGVQETDLPWTKYLPYYLELLSERYGLEYEWNQYWVDNVPNMSSILYNKSRLKPVDYSMHEFSYMVHRDYKIRVLTWIVLTDAKSKANIALINTHWDIKKENNPWELEEETDLIRDLEQKYDNIPIFCTGDFNSHINLASEKFMEMAKVYDFKEMAEEQGTLANKISGIVEGIYIDHVYCNRKLKILHYETADNEHYRVLSDHLPHYADFVM